MTRHAALLRNAKSLAAPARRKNRRQRRAALDRIAAARKRGEATRHGRRVPVAFGDDDWVLLMGNLAPDEGSVFADPNYVPTE